MPDIRVDPPSLREAAAKLSEAADRTRRLAEEAAESAASAPSYDGQFGNQFQSMGSEAYAQMNAVATKLTALSEALLLKADEFEAADLDTQHGLAGLFAQFRSWLNSLCLPLGPQPASPWAFLSADFEWLFKDAGPENGGEPWYTPLAIELSKAWNWYHRNVNQPIYDGLESWRGIRENGNKIALYYLAQIWLAYDKVVNQPIYESAETWRGNLDNARTIVLYSLARLWFGYDKAVNQPIYGLYAVQGPGADSDDPITEYLDKFSSVDASGNLISPVGAELKGVIESRQDGVTITFVDFNAGIVPWQGYVVLPPDFADGGQLGSPGNVGLVSHELTHVLERDLNDLMYWPSGAPSLEGAPLYLEGARIFGDSTNYMEVLSNIVGLTVEYDTLSSVRPSDAELQKIEDKLATFTDTDAPNATRYLVKSENNVEVYRDNYVLELGISDHRIPAGGWDDWLKKMGFSDAAIQHIRDIASRGTAIQVGSSELDPNTGLLAPATPTPTATAMTTPAPTLTPTASSTPSPAPTSTVASSPSSPTPVSQTSASAFPSPTPTPGKPTP